MKYHPKLFKAEMVRAILEGRKTQTRLPVTFHNCITVPHVQRDRWPCLQFDKATVSDGACLKTPILGNNFAPIKNPEIIISVYPRYKVGDHLYVRETWTNKFEDNDLLNQWVAYKADGAMRFYYDEVFDNKTDALIQNLTGLWRPSIHMPRWASRINLEVTRRWPERVQEITDNACFKEGVKVDGTHANGRIFTARDHFWGLWDSCYGQGAWKQNGYVWAYEFKR